MTAGYKYYYVNDNAQPTGEHEVHQSDCAWLAYVNSKTLLGYYDNCKDAVKESKNRHYVNSDGCYYCCPSCHTR